MNLISDIFLVAYHFLFAVFSNLVHVTFILYLYSFFLAPVQGLCCKPKYRANVIHHFMFVFFLYFFSHSSYRKDQFIVLILKLFISSYHFSVTNLSLVVKLP